MRYEFIVGEPFVVTPKGLPALTTETLVTLL